MDTQVRTPQAIFTQPQRLIVPLFQRPYVWNRERQWEPLWSDVARMAERRMDPSGDRPQPHFLGAVVLQQVANPSGSMQERTVIDGQQRLTTLQLLFDAIHAELHRIRAVKPAARIEALIENNEAFCKTPEDRFKVWPTNKDRPAFNAIMAAPQPVEYESLNSDGSLLTDAHQYFAEMACRWLSKGGSDEAALRAEHLETTVREGLQLVVIDLASKENAQEIFETLNARGTPLTAADLIKNFVFQRLLESGQDEEAAYHQYWQDFESSFWEAEVQLGRLKFSQSSIFLNHWLIAQTGEVIVTREIFPRFKRFVDDCDDDMVELLAIIRENATVYRRFIESAKRLDGTVERTGLFAYRTDVLESETIKPLVLYLLDPRQTRIPPEQLAKAWSVIESWMVRRMIVRATTSSYTQVIAELITHLRTVERELHGDAIEAFFRRQTANSRYWPDDEEVRQQLKTLPAYKRLSRGRMRMLLEAVEDHRRGFVGEQEGLGGQRVRRGKMAIEHILPQAWREHWPVDDPIREVEREALVHTLGNLTLLTGKLNSKASNAAWVTFDGVGKRSTLNGHDTLFLNRDLLQAAGDEWDEQSIRRRTEQLTDSVLQIWPTPKGHAVTPGREPAQPRRRIDLGHLVSADMIEIGSKLFPNTKKHRDQVPVVLSDGGLEWNNRRFSSPFAAAKAITGWKTVNVWDFFLIDPDADKTLGDVRTEYLEAISVTDDDDQNNSV